MNDESKTKAQLIEEVTALRQKVAELERVIGDRQQTERELEQFKAELEVEVAKQHTALLGSNELLIAEMTERLEVEEALRAIKAQLEAVLETIPGIVSWISTDLRYLGVNRYLASIYGLTPDAFVGKDIGFLQSSSDFTEFVRDFFASPAQESFREVSAVVHGETRNFLIVMKKYEQGQATFAVGIDITERYQVETALREAEEKYRSIFENAIEGIFQTTPDGYYISANPALARIYGYNSPGELVANLTSVQQQLYVDPNRRTEFTRLLHDQGVVVGFVSQVYHRDGSLIWISENAHAIYDDYGNILYYEGTVEDITERKLAEEALQRINEKLETRVEERTSALRELNRRMVTEIAERQRAEAALRNSEAELRALFAAMTDVIAVFDSQGRYLKMVATNSELLYRPDIERVGKTVFDVLPLTQANLFFNHIQLAIKTGQAVSLEYNLPVSKPELFCPMDGNSEERWFVANVSPLPDNRVIWVARDITQRKQSEEALRQAEEKYRSIFENAAEGIFQTTPEGCYISVNPALARMYAYSSEAELLSHLTNIEEQLYVNPDRRTEFVTILEEKGVISNFESQVYRKDGTIIWTSENARVVRDLSDGQVLYYEGTVEDITKRKQAEEALRQSEAKERERSQQLTKALTDLQQAQIRLVQSEKMSSLGQLVAGVAHEINNPVNFIYGNLAYANRYTKDLLELLQLYRQVLSISSPEIQEKSEAMDLDFIMGDLPRLMASMRVGAERICEIVRSLQTFSRIDEADLKTVDVHEGIDSTLMILQHRLKAEADCPAIQVVKKYGELPGIKCYAGQLNQVFMNIFSNAIDALEESFRRLDPLTPPFESASLNGQHAPQTSDLTSFKPQNSALKTEIQPTITVCTEVLNEDWIAIHIIDNGPGMDQAAQQRVFDPFFTTKDIGKGTGLGMSISHQIVVERHGGQIRCVSAPGEGAEFIIELPVQAFKGK